jgi:thioredoxin 2
MAPMFEQAAAELEPDVRLLKVNADEEPRIASELGVTGIPALLLLRGGQVIARTAGAMDTRRIVAWTRSHLAGAA